MSRRAIIYIVCGVVAFHMLVFLVLARVDPMPKYKKIPRPAKPNFKHYEWVEVDSATGEKTIYRDIEVSTKLTPRETLTKKGTPAPAKGEQAAGHSR